MNISYLYDFNSNVDINDWQIVDDGVMGGLSKGNIELNEAGHAIYTGQISLENYGGFSSVRCRFTPKSTKKYNKIVLRIRGDGKRYQFRIKANQNDRHSYISYFETNKEWQSVEIPLVDMYPTFRGRKLDFPNFDQVAISEIAFLIGNKEVEDFQLEIDFIQLK